MIIVNNKMTVRHGEGSPLAWRDPVLNDRPIIKSDPSHSPDFTNPHLEISFNSSIILHHPAANDGLKRGRCKEMTSVKDILWLGKLAGCDSLTVREIHTLPANRCPKCFRLLGCIF